MNERIASCCFAQIPIRLIAFESLSSRLLQIMLEGAGTRARLLPGKKVSSTMRILSNGGQRLLR